MKKINIVKDKRDFNRIIRNNIPYKSKNYIIYLEKNNDVYKFGISVSKKLGNAVFRNKIKRQLKNIIDKKDYQNSFNCIIIVRRGIINLSFKEMKEELYNCFNKINILKGE